MKPLKGKNTFKDQAFSNYVKFNKGKTFKI